MSYATEQSVLNAQSNAAQEAQIAEQARRAPHVLMRPRIFPDGNAWCALYGENIQEGVVGFGETPEAAAADFDLAWRQQVKAPHGVAPTVPVNRPATMDEAQHAAQIGACLPNGVLFDAFGRERVRYVRVIHDGTTCVVPPGDVADMVDSERPDDYRTEDVYLSKEEFDALPEFDGF